MGKLIYLKTRNKFRRIKNVPFFNKAGEKSKEKKAQRVEIFIISFRETLFHLKYMCIRIFQRYGNLP